MSLVESLFEDGAESLFQGGIESIFYRILPKMRDLDYDYRDAKKPWLSFVKEIPDFGKPAIFIDSGAWNSLGVRVKSGNWTIIMDLEKRKLNGRQYFHTLIRVPYKMTDNFRFDIAYKGRLESRYIGFGWSKLKTADNKFNLNYFLRSNNQSKLKTLISDPIFQVIAMGFVELLKERLRHPPYFCFRTIQRGFWEDNILDDLSLGKKLKKNDYPSLKRGIGELEFMVNRVIKDVDQLKLYFGFIEVCLQCLTSMGCASPEPVNFSRALADRPHLIYPAESVELISKLDWLESRFGKKNETVLVKSNQFNTLISQL